MRNARRVVGILGALAGGAFSCGGVLAGCGGDDTGVVSAADGGDATADGAGDAPAALDSRADVASDSQAADARKDTGTPPDAGRDVAVADVTVADVTVADVTLDVRPDATLDATVDAICTTCVLDARADATLDAPFDAPPDVAPDVAIVVIDAGVDAPSDAPPDVADVGPDRSAELAFPGQVATALCNQSALCCFPDGGTSGFDMASCISQFTGSGYNHSSFGESAIPNGNVVYNPDAGAACLAAINAIAGCTVDAGLQPQLLTNCFGALTGTLQVGASCQASLECAPGEYCAPTDGGASGVCASLRGQNQPCGDLGANSDQYPAEVCSYRGSGIDTHNTCATIDDAGNTPPTTSWTCQPQYPIGTPCNFDTDCVTPMICDVNSGNCVADSRQLVFPGTFCSNYILDAGGGG